MALLFKSALNEIIIDRHKRRQERRERRRQLLLDLHEHMGLFDAGYVLVTAKAFLDAAAGGLDPASGAAGEVRAASRMIDENFSERLQASLDFVHRHELEMPEPIRSSIGRLTGAMRIPDADALTDPADARRRTAAVMRFAEEIRTEIRRSVH